MFRWLQSAKRPRKQVRCAWCYATAMPSPIPSHLLCRTPGAPPVMCNLRVRGDHPRRCVTSGEALNLVDPATAVDKQEARHVIEAHDFPFGQSGPRFQREMAKLND